MRRCAGLALLLVSGLLACMAVMAVSFVVMARLERSASFQRTLTAQAHLLARSGLEDALARADAGQEPAYGGEDWDGSGGPLSAFELPEEVFQPGTPNAADCPVRHALRPSFFARIQPSPNPRLVPVDGRQRGYSGILDGGGVYALRVADSEGLFVNGGDLTSAGEHPATYDATLKRILGNLAEELGLPRADGEALVVLRPAGGWRSFDEIRVSALGGSQAKLEVLRPCLVLEAWVDRKVVRPNIDPAWSPPASGFLRFVSAAAWAEIKVGQRDTPTAPFGDPIDAYFWNAYGMMMSTGCIGRAWTGRRAFNPATGSYAPDFERDSAGRIVGRAPVGLNWARTRPPVLKALLRGLGGVFADADVQDSTPTSNAWTARMEGGIAALYKVALGAPEVDAVVAALQAHAGFPTWTTEFPDWDQTPSFDSWDEFGRFVDLKLSALTPAQRDLLKAHFNPNTALNKFNPGESVYKALDKTDLTAYSTEFSFRSPMREVACCGRVRDAAGRVLAERLVSATLRFRQVRLTAQSEFCAGNLGDPEVAGDETASRLPGDPGFLAASGGLDRTHGSRFPGNGHGFCLQTYPEPQWPGSPCPPPARYDGNLQLATVDLDASAVPGLTFLAAYDAGYDATVAAGKPTCSLDARHGSPSASLLGSAPVGTQAVLNQIYPDGTYAETYRAPGYEARGNIGDGYQGIVSFWYRPFFGNLASYPWSVRYQTPLLLNVLDASPLLTTNLMGNTQMFEISFRKDSGGIQGTGFLLENCCDHLNPDDDHREDGPFFGWMWNPAGCRTFQHAHRWMLITAQWNVRATQSAQYGYFQINGTSHLAVPSGCYRYAVNIAPNHGAPNGGTQPLATMTCLTRDCYRGDGSLGTPYFYLGLRGARGIGGESPADGTLDELAFVTRTTDMNDGRAFADVRYQAGRYYKENGPPGAYGVAPSAYTSAPLALGAGARLLRADWTLVMPREYAGPAGIPDLWPSPNRAFFGTGLDRVSGHGADVAFTPRDLAGAPLLPAPLTRDGARIAVCPPGGILRLGLDIRPRLDDNAGAWTALAAPLMESPVLDDLTLTYVGPGGAAVSAWREGD